MAREPHTAHDIRFKKMHPIFIRYFFKWLWLKNTHVIDQNIDFLHGLNQVLAAVRVGNVARDSRDIRMGM